MRDTQALFMPGEALPPDVAETSANFDLDDVIGFLERITTLPGVDFNIGSMAFAGEMIADIPVKETRTFERVGHVNGQMQLLTITAFMSDTDAPALYFSGQKDLIDLIDGLIVDQDSS